MITALTKVVLEVLNWSGQLHYFHFHFNPLLPIGQVQISSCHPLGIYIHIVLNQEV